MHACALHLQIRAAEHPRGAPVEAIIEVADIKNDFGVLEQRGSLQTAALHGSGCLVERGDGARIVKVDALRGVQRGVFGRMRCHDHRDAELAIHA